MSNTTKKKTHFCFVYDLYAYNSGKMSFIDFDYRWTTKLDDVRL